MTSARSPTINRYLSFPFPCLVIADVICLSDLRRSSVPSQQHLIVDAPDIRSQFQALQRNGFSSTGSGLRCVNCDGSACCDL